MDISKVINDVIDDVSLKTDTGSVDLSDAYHAYLVKEELKKYLDEDVIEELMIAEASSDDPKKSKFISTYSFLKKNGDKFYDALNTASKVEDFKSFIKNLPTGGPLKLTKVALEKFTASDIKSFVSFLYSKSEVKPGKLPSGGAAGKLFDLKPDGAGRGEVYLAALCKDSFIQGGSESFDLQTKTTKYEVKDYSTSGTSIRAGVEAAISKFKFWKQILKTVDVVKAVEKESGWALIPDSTEKDELIKIKDHIINRVEKEVKIVTGEYNKTDQKYMLDFYAIANKLLTVRDTSFNQVVFRGPNQKPTTFSIDPIEQSELSSGKKLSLNLSNAKGDLPQLINYLNRLDYVRDPNAFTSDIAAAMKAIIEDGPAQKWIIFRKTGMKVIDAKGSNFQYEQISQNGVKFKEIG